MYICLAGYIFCSVLCYVFANNCLRCTHSSNPQLFAGAFEGRINVCCDNNIAAKYTSSNEFVYMRCSDVIIFSISLFIALCRHVVGTESIVIT